MWNRSIELENGKEKEERVYKASNLWLVAYSLTFQTISLGLMIETISVSNSNFYIFFMFPFFCIDTVLVAGSIMGVTSPNSKTIEDMDPFGSLTREDIACKCCTKMNIEAFGRFFKLINLVYILAIWFRPFGLYSSINGYKHIGTKHFSSLAGQSTCNRDFITDSPYNPNGAFPHDLYGRKYDVNVPGIYCTLDAEYAAPNYKANYIIGYKRYSTIQPVKNIDCSNPTGASQGYLAIECEDRSFLLKSFPDLSIGVNQPVDIVFSTNVDSSFCPGNTPNLQCFHPLTLLPVPSTSDVCVGGKCPYKPGKPTKICSECLDYLRDRLGVTDGPEGYEHCPYNPYPLENRTVGACSFCPGYGVGWLAGERFDKGAIGVVFGLFTAYLINAGLEVILLFIVFRRRNFINKRKKI